MRTQIRLRLACEKEHELHVAPAEGDESQFKDIRLSLNVSPDGREIRLRGSRTEGNQLIFANRTSPSNWEYEYIFQGITPLPRFSRFEAWFDLLEGDILAYRLPEIHLLPWPKTQHGHEGDSARLLVDLKAQVARSVGYDMKLFIRDIPAWFKSHITPEEWCHIFEEELRHARHDRPGNTVHQTGRAHSASRRGRL